MLDLQRYPINLYLMDILFMLDLQRYPINIYLMDILFMLDLQRYPINIYLMDILFMLDLQRYPLHLYLMDIWFMLDLQRYPINLYLYGYLINAWSDKGYRYESKMSLYKWWVYTVYSSLKRPVPFFPLLRMQQTGSSELFSSTHIQSPNSKIKTFVLGFIWYPWDVCTVYFY